MEKEAFSQMKLITSLIKIAHSGEAKTEEAKIDNIYNLYNDIGLKTVKADPYLFAHFLAWNHKNGKVNDSKVAFPIIALRGDPQFAENAICHAVSLGPRELLRTYFLNRKFVNAGETIQGRKRRVYQWAGQKYLKIRQEDKKWFDRTALQHRRALKLLYKLFHMKPNAYAQQVLFEKKYPKNSVFEVVKNLKNMSDKEAAGNIINHKIPLTVAMGAVAKISKNIQLSLLENMTGNEVLNNSKLFEKLGVMQDIALKAAYEAAIERAKKDKKVNVYKASKAKEHVSKKTADKLVSVQREQEKKQKKLEGDWLIHCDISYSMTPAIEPARKVAALVASSTEGKTHMIFANDQPIYYDVTGFDYQKIYDKTKFIVAHGNTSIGCGLDYLLKKNIPVNGIVIVSDGGEWVEPLFPKVYEKYCDSLGIEPNVYHLWLKGDPNKLQREYIKKIDINENFDEYTFPNLLNVLKANKYQLLDDIMGTPLLTFDKVFR